MFKIASKPYPRAERTKSPYTWLMVSKKSGESTDDDPDGDEKNPPGENNGEGGDEDDGRKFTQEDVNRIISDRLKDEKKRLASDIRKEIEDDIREKLEADQAEKDGDYQKLLDKEQKKAAKLQEKIDEFERDATKAELEKLRITVARDEGLHESAAEWILGETKDEMVANAKKLMTTFGERVAPDTDQGKGDQNYRKPRSTSSDEDEPWKKPEFWNQ